MAKLRTFSAIFHRGLSYYPFRYTHEIRLSHAHLAKIEMSYIAKNNKTRSQFFWRIILDTTVSYDIFEVRSGVMRAKKRGSVFHYDARFMQKKCV